MFSDGFFILADEQAVNRIRGGLYGLNPYKATV